MPEQEKGSVPDDLKDAIAENLRHYMRVEGYDHDNPLDIARLAKVAEIHVRTLERLLRRDTYPGNQPTLRSLASLAAALRVETHHLVYKPRITGEGKSQLTKSVSNGVNTVHSAKRNKR